jgi:boron transporter
MPPKFDIDNDGYKWPNDGSLWQRVRHPGWGMYCDVRRRLPYYWSDIKDGFNYRTFAGTVRILFVNLLPALAFQLDMHHNTGGFFGINEALLSSLMAAVVFSLFSCQPLTVVGITGLISLFNYTIYDIIKIYDVEIYREFHLQYISATCDGRANTA